MIWWLCVLIGIGVGIWITIDNYGDFREGAAMSALCGFCGFLIALIICLIASCGTFTIVDTDVVSTTEICALNDNTMVNGHIGGGIFCASGYIDEDYVYVVLVNTDKGLKIETYKTDKTYVQYTDETPRVEEIRNGVSKGADFFFGDGFMDTTEYIIYIPTNSQVANNYVIDLE